MVWSVALLANRQGAPEEQLRLIQPVGRLQQQGKVVEANRDVWMIWSVALLVDRQGAPEERLCLAQPVGDTQQYGEIVQVRRDGDGPVRSSSHGSLARACRAAPPRSAGLWRV